MKTRSFTLIEVVVALAILSISIAGFLQLLTAAQNRIIKVNDHWMRTHMLIQAAEYYMLMKQEEPPAMTDTFFPYDDYRVEVTYEEIDNLPEEYTGLTNQKQLRAMVLSLRRQNDGQEVDKIIIDRIDYENASESTNYNQAAGHPGGTGRGNGDHDLCGLDHRHRLGGILQCLETLGAGNRHAEGPAEYRPDHGCFHPEYDPVFVEG